MCESSAGAKAVGERLFQEESALMAAFEVRDPRLDPRLDIYLVWDGASDE